MNRFHTLPFLLLLLAGCSAKDPPTATPSYHAGPQTGTSAPINSWEIGQNTTSTPKRSRPLFPPERSQRGLEPYDALAEKVYAALQADGSVPLKYVTVSAERGTVCLSGTVRSAREAAHLIGITKSVAGVQSVRSVLIVRGP